MVMLFQRLFVKTTLLKSYCPAKPIQLQLRCLLRKTEQKLYKINTSSISIDQLIKKTNKHKVFMNQFYTSFKYDNNKDDIWGTSVIQFLSELEGKKKLRVETTNKLVICSGNWTFTSCVSAFVLPSIFDFAACTLSLPV